MTTRVDAEVPGVETPTELRATERCDRCGAQAYVMTEHGSGQLLWCAHHYAENEGVLNGLKVLDDRAKINTAASPSAY